MTLRRIAPLFAVLLAASPVLAGPADGVRAIPPAPRAALVEVFGSADQALLLDRQSGRYQVVQPGDSFGDFVVSAVFPDQVVLTASGNHSFVLPLVSRAALAKAGPAQAGTATPPSTEVLDPWSTQALPASPSRPADPVDDAEVIDPYNNSPVTSPAPAAPQDPYSDPAQPLDSGEVLDPYSDPAAEQPDPAEVIDPYGGAAGDIPTVRAPSSSRAGNAPPAKSADPAKPGPATRAKPAVREQFSLSRAELDRALDDFSALGKEIRIRPASGGGIEVVDLARGSFFARLGLKSGDVVRKVGGRALRSVDDAAAAYAELLSSSSMEVEIERAGRGRILDIRLTR